jgi:hypothetical protein
MSQSALFNIQSNIEVQAVKLSLVNPQSPVQIAESFAKLATLPKDAQDYVTGELNAGYTLGARALKNLLPQMKFLVAAVDSGVLDIEDALAPEVQKMTRGFLLERMVAGKLIEFTNGNVSPEVKLYTDKIAEIPADRIANPFACVAAMIAFAEALPDDKPKLSPTGKAFRAGGLR